MFSGRLFEDCIFQKKIYGIANIAKIVDASVCFPISLRANMTLDSFTCCLPMIWHLGFYRKQQLWFKGTAQISGSDFITREHKARIVGERVGGKLTRVIFLGSSQLFVIWQMSLLLPSWAFRIRHLAGNPYLWCASNLIMNHWALVSSEAIARKR